MNNQRFTILALNAKKYKKLNDTKLYRRDTILEDHKALQDDLANLEDWSTKWNLCFNSNKCKVIIGHSNPQHEYVMYRGGPPIMLDTTTNEKDLGGGVHVDANLTFEHHVEDVDNKANRMLERSGEHTHS